MRVRAEQGAPNAQAARPVTGHNPRKMPRPRRRCIVCLMHLSRPMYEGLPWFYIAAGLGALGVSYLIGDTHIVGLLVGLAGLAALLLGVVVVLRRRDYRELRSHYGQSDLTRPADQD
jgi:hypothetical protein